jgi:hypothetical protein
VDGGVGTSTFGAGSGGVVGAGEDGVVGRAYIHIINLYQYFILHFLLNYFIDLL